VLSAALDSGVAVSVVLIFFCLQYPKNGTIGLNTIQTWWGNTYVLSCGFLLPFYLPWEYDLYSVPFTTADALGTPLFKVAKGDFFG